FDIRYLTDPSACLCLLHFGNAEPYISMRSSSRSSSQRMVNGQLKTVYDISSQQEANDLSGKMVHSRRYDFQSDFAPPIHEANGNLFVH
ncbi:hypothetical protein KR038_006371, partial [Drosophila bunnanda]